MKKQTSLTLVLALAAGLTTEAQALDQIIRPYQSVRTSAIGGTRITSGLYDENFFGNPARVTANPRWRFTVLSPSFEVNTSAIDTVGDLLGSGDMVQKLSETTGKNNHVRIQTTFPSLYLPTGDDGRWAWGFGLITSVQSDVALRQSYRLALQSYVDVGPAVTVGRKFLENKELSIGLTGHLMYRVATPEEYTFADFLKLNSTAIESIGRGGSMVDFDLGATYLLPWTWKEFSFDAGVALNNLLGGKYSNLGIDPLETESRPTAQPRSLGFGVAAHRATLGPFSDFVLALESTDIGNNPNGSPFRTIHLGTEARYGVLVPRLGINQGYLTAGLGVMTRFFSFEYATYGEEMTLNPGGFEDRRHALRLSFQLDGSDRARVTPAVKPAEKPAEKPVTPAAPVAPAPAAETPAAAATPTPTPAAAQ